MSKVEREYYEVVPSVFGLFGWKLVRMTGYKQWETILRFKKKDEAVRDTAKYLEHARAYGHFSELTIKSKLGRIQDKRTYGADPRNRKG